MMMGTRIGRFYPSAIMNPAFVPEQNVLISASVGTKKTSVTS